MNIDNTILSVFRHILCRFLIVNVVALYISNPVVYGQTISWNGYTAGTMSYSSGPLSAVITNTPGSYYINSSPRYHATTNSDIHPPNNNCGAVGLLMEMDWGSNANTQNYATTLTMNFAECVYGPITFRIFDINTDNYNTWGDWIDISATANTGALSAPSVSGCTPNTSVSGNTRRLRGGIASSSNTTGCTCGTTNVSVGSAANKITSITIKYYADPAAWNTSPYNPAYQYIIISNLTVGNITCTLPIELISFTGKCTDGVKAFQWSTASELNNDFFTIEHSRDAIDFNAVADDIKGAGTSHQLIQYAQEMREVEPGYRFYRLKQTDFDGRYTYSEIIKTGCETSSLKMDYTVFADVSSPVINVLCSRLPDTPVKFEVYDALGKLMTSSDFVRYDSKEISIPMNNCGSGIYFVKLSDAGHSLDVKPRPVRLIKN